LKAAAPGQKSHLISVNVHAGTRRGFQEFDGVPERLSRLERKRRSDFLSETSVALSAHIDLSIAGKLGGVGDGFPSSRAVPRTVAGRMLLAGTVAAFAGNSQDKIRSVITIHEARRSERSEVSRMAFNATGRYGPVKICLPVQISRAVDPLAKLRPVGNGELKEFISFPIQVCLPLSSGADYDANRLRMFLCVWRLSEDCRFIKTAVSGIHSERETSVDRFHGVV
jgi:hypothetical protein